METNKTYIELNDNILPAIPVHPGEILGEEIKARGLQQKVFAESIGIQPSHLSAIIHGTRSITPSVASKIASGLSGISSDFWTKLQEKYNKSIIRSKTNTSKLVYGYHFDTEEPEFALAQPDAEYGSSIKKTINIPSKDLSFLKSLANRLGWIIEPSIYFSDKL